MFNPMSARTPIRNRLARPLPERWRTWLVEQGVPKRKYSCIAAVTLADGTRLDRVIIEEGWIISTAAGPIPDTFEEKIDFDPGQVIAIEVQHVI